MFSLFKKQTVTADSSEDSNKEETQTQELKEEKQLHVSEHQKNADTTQASQLEEEANDLSFLSYLTQIREYEQELQRQKQDLITVKTGLQDKVKGEIASKEIAIDKLEQEVQCLEDEVMQLYVCFEPSSTKYPS
jgi:hypothetical protein